MTTLGVAILGMSPQFTLCSGIFVRTEHLPAVLACQDFSLKAIYSRKLATAQALEGVPAGVDFYSNDSDKSLDDLLARPDIQAVIIALPITAQPAIIQRCLTAGKHVLSEKPVAPSLADADFLLKWRDTHARDTPLWAVAENFRYQTCWYWAHQQIVSLGRILSFSVKVTSLTDTAGKWYNTEWRKEPDYQGGFVLDGGVHFVAALQILLGQAERVTKVSAFTAKNMSHLPPVDTLSATCQTVNGVVGQLMFSWGTTDRAWEFRVGCEGGVVVVGAGGIVNVRKTDGTEETKSFAEESTGVKNEVVAFADAIRVGKLDIRQKPELAVKDLEFVEKMIKSGEQGGVPMEIVGDF